MKLRRMKPERKDGNGNILGKYTTGQDGTVTVTGLVPGSTVVAVETKVPKGYVLNPTPQTIIIKKGSGNSVISGGSTSSSGAVPEAMVLRAVTIWILRTTPPLRWSSRRLRTARISSLCRAWNF